jgi:formylglycine-generating enzyme required for sulfatase activity
VTLQPPGGSPIRQAVLLARGERHEVDLVAPAAVPDGFIYIPPGRFLFGSADDEIVRRTMLPARPLHQATTGAFFIQRTEVTFRQWIEFLRALSPQERDLRRPRANDYFGTVDLTETGDGWQLVLAPPPRQVIYRVNERQPVRYRNRTAHIEQDWLDFPVAGISFSDAGAYVTWLAHSGRVVGARLCDEREWERAARGADGRIYPHGDRLDRDDANIDITYGQNALSFGPDVVGSHPASDSPFGVADLSGNVWEWMQPAPGSSAPQYGGGSFYQDVLSARSNNRIRGDTEMRTALIGLRVCADVPR